MPKLNSPKLYADASLTSKSKGMSELQVIEAALAGAARRRRWQQALNGLGRGLLAGGLTFLVALVAFKVLPLPAWAIPAAGIIAAVLALGGMIWGAWRKPSLLETARWVDERRQLKERLSTALELKTVRAPDDWKQLILSDAAKYAQTLNSRELIPIGLPRAVRWVLLVAALCVGLGFVPEYRSKAHIQKQQDAANIKDTGKNLSELVRRELAQKPPVLPPTEKAMQQAVELGDKLGK